ncbi:hypothetical protein K0B90_12470 [bacterium]|nr:hypothetical protein [bacterium]
MNQSENRQKESGVCFTSLEAFRKALTPKRLGLVRLIRESAPASLVFGSRNMFSTVQS